VKRPSAYRERRPLTALAWIGYAHRTDDSGIQGDKVDMMQADQADIAKSVIEQMGSQIDLLVTLALAVCGGLTALFLQIVIHNHDRSVTAVRFKRDFFLMGCLICEGASIICGYLSRATITSLTPKILQLDFSHIDNWTRADFEGSLALRILAGAQALLFLIGIFLVLGFLVFNADLLRKKDTDELQKISTLPPSRPSSRGGK
jgi:hypothetical protein